jgi:hypothetical protein
VRNLWNSGYRNERGFCISEVVKKRNNEIPNSLPGAANTRKVGERIAIAIR